MDHERFQASDMWIGGRGRRGNRRGVRRDSRVVHDYRELPSHNGEGMESETLTGEQTMPGFRR